MSLKWRGLLCTNLPSICEARLISRRLRILIVCPWGSPDSNRSGPMDCAWYLEVGIQFEWLLPGLAQGCSVGFTACVTSQAPSPSWAVVISSENWGGLRQSCEPLLCLATLFCESESMAKQVARLSVLSRLAQQFPRRCVTPCGALVPPGCWTPEAALRPGVCDYEAKPRGS